MKKSIVFLCQRVPYPPDRGDRITTWNFLVHLSEHYNVHIFCLTSDKKEQEKEEILKKYCASVHIQYKSIWRSCWDAILALFCFIPLTNAYYFSSSIQKKIQALIDSQKIDLVYAYSSNMFPHVYKKNPKTPIVYHYGDVDSEKFRKMAKCGKLFLRPVYWLEFHRLRKWELECSQAASASVFATEQEGKLFQSLGGQGKIVAIPNGVDIDYFKRQDESIPMENAFIFTGVMNYFPNVDTILCFYHEVYPLIKNIMPEIRFYIVGSRPAPEIVAIGQQDPSCIVTGYVPDVRPYMCKAKLFVAPMKVAQGMQNKILEAMSMSVPVITYSQIAQPLGLDENDGVVKVNDPLEMSRAIERLMHNEEERARLARSARKSVVEKYHWKPQLQKLTNLVEEITAAKPV